jgi:hypothetical protein
LSQSQSRSNSQNNSQSKSKSGSQNQSKNQSKSIIGRTRHTPHATHRYPSTVLLVRPAVLVLPTLRTATHTLLSTDNARRTTTHSTQSRRVRDQVVWESYPVVFATPRHSGFWGRHAVARCGVGSSGRQVSGYVVRRFSKRPRALRPERIRGGYGAEA